MYLAKGFIGTGALLHFIVCIIRGNFGKLNIYTKRLRLHKPNSDWIYIVYFIGTSRNLISWTFSCLLYCFQTINCFHSKVNKRGLQPVSRPVELAHYLRGWDLVKSPFGAKAVQTVSLLAMLVCMGRVCCAKAKEDWRCLWHCIFDFFTPH